MRMESVEMNVYHRKDGRWEGRISKGKNKDGKRKYQYIFEKTKEKVINRIQAIRKENSEINSSKCKLLFSDVYTGWFDTIKHNIKESTASNYQMKAEKHILPYFGDIAVNSITQELIYNFVSDKRRNNLSERYISDIIILIKTIFKYAVKTYHIENPFAEITLQKKKKTEITLLDDIEQEKLKEHIRNKRNRSTLGVAIAISTGLRIGEICPLQWKDIDLQKRILTVSKTMQRIQCKNSKSKTKLIITDPKSESSCRQIPIPDCLMDILFEFKGKDEEYVLTGTEKYIEPRTMQYRFKAILKNVNLPSIHFHALRHIFASNCIKLGFDIKTLSELLGHSSVEITLNRYVHSSFELKRDYMNKIEI